MGSLGKQSLGCPREACQPRYDDLHWYVFVVTEFYKQIQHTKAHILENSQPMIVLAIRGREAKPIDAQKITNWQFLPGGQNIRISTVVGEKLLLRIEESNLEGE